MIPSHASNIYILAKYIAGRWTSTSAQTQHDQINTICLLPKDSRVSDSFQYFHKFQECPLRVPSSSYRASSNMPLHLPKTILYTAALRILLHFQTHTNAHSHSRPRNPIHATTLPSQEAARRRTRAPHILTQPTARRTSEIQRVSAEYQGWCRRESCW